MGWKETLTEQTKTAYKATEGLISLLSEGDLDWKPATGENWMTVGQLLAHLSESCGTLMRSFVTGEWDLPEEGAGTAETLPAIGSLAEAKERLAADKQVALDTLAGLTDDDLCNHEVTAPWEKTPRPLGAQLGVMVTHIESHKSQLFYYLKLQGKPVHTGHLWGGM
jgi:uncharacterized damage-inducible protein DinB